MINNSNMAHAYIVPKLKKEKRNELRQINIDLQYREGEISILSRRGDKM